MKVILGGLLFLAGVALGVYAGLWWAFVGGIVQIVDALQATPISGVDIALGVLRVCCAGLIGVLTAFVACIPGYAMLKSAE